MQAATHATLANLVEQHVTSLIRESAVVNRHSKRGGLVSCGDDDIHRVERGGGHDDPQQKKKRRRIIHHDDVNLALSWRGSEKLYVSGVPLTAPARVDPAGREAGDGAKGSHGGGLRQLLRNAKCEATVPSLRKSRFVPRVNLNAYLQTELAVRPPCEVGMTLHWLAVDGSQPMEVWDDAGSDLTFEGVGPVLDLDDDGAGAGGRDAPGGDPSIRVRELQQRLLSEELQLYYARVAAALERAADAAAVAAALRGLRADAGIQELVPFLSRFVARGLVARGNLRRTELCRRLVAAFDAMLDNRDLHLDLYLHQMFSPVGTCIVARRLASSRHEDHWSLRQEAARCLVKACNVYGDQYTTMRPRIIKLLTQQALRLDRPLATQYGGIVGISLFGPRAVDAFLLPIAREYWEHWEGKLHDMTEAAKKDGKLEEEQEYEVHMCQQALLNALQIFVQNVSLGEQAKRVDSDSLTDVFGERLIVMRPDVTDYMSAFV